jgi:hypothetical protein
MYLDFHKHYEFYKSNEFPFSNSVMFIKVHREEVQKRKIIEAKSLTEQSQINGFLISCHHS